MRFFLNLRKYADAATCENMSAWKSTQIKTPNADFLEKSLAHVGASQSDTSLNL